MKNKKIKTLLARELRYAYQLDFIDAIKLSKGILKDDIPNTLYDLGFHSYISQIPACGRGCCYQDGPTVYEKRNKKDKLVEFTVDELKLFKINTFKQYGRKQYE